MSEAAVASKGAKKSAQKNYIVPVRMNDMSIFDGAFTFMKQRFGEEMRRIDDEMTKLSKNLLSLYGETTVLNAGMIPDRETCPSCWENVTSSPLIEDEGEDKMLKLQFDVGQFEPDEIAVNIVENTLVVAAQHEEKSDASAVSIRYHRELRLPNGVDPETVESMLSKDGVLTVRAPLHLAYDVHTEI